MRFLVVFIFLLSGIEIYGQDIMINGKVTTKSELPIQGVLVMAFNNGRLLKSHPTDDKGDYSFYVPGSVFDVLYYKPGMPSHSFRVNNRLDRETQGINRNVYLNDTLAETSVDLRIWLKNHSLTAKTLDSLYNAEIEKIPPPVVKRKSRKQIEKEAKAEQQRFANYKESTVKDSVDRQVTTTIIGPDTYEKVTNEKGANKYFKNSKPITEVTYRFETTRRYEGVLKSSKNVKHFDKYKPMEHTKG